MTEKSKVLCVVNGCRNHKENNWYCSEHIASNKTFQRTPFGALDVQIAGSHYNARSIQPIEYVYANSLGFCEGNVVKYVTRHPYKNGIQDLKKAKHYIELLHDITLVNDLPGIVRAREVNIEPAEFCAANNISVMEARIIEGITYWDRSLFDDKLERLIEVHSNLNELINYLESIANNNHPIDDIARGNFHE